MIENLQQSLNELKQANRGRFAYVLARAEGLGVDDACERAGYGKSWYYRFDQEERDRLEEIATALHHEEIELAHQMLTQVLPEATKVKIGGLKSRDEKIRQAASTEIMDRKLGKPAQSAQHSGGISLGVDGVEWRSKSS
jgi:hypothetical protein